MTQADEVGGAAASAALLLGTAYAAVTAYWATGGTGLLDTVGGVFQEWGRRGGLGVFVLLWVVVLVKLVAAVLPRAARRCVGSAAIYRWPGAWRAPTGFSLGSTDWS